MSWRYQHNSIHSLYERHIFRVISMSLTEQSHLRGQEHHFCSYCSHKQKLTDKRERARQWTACSSVILITILKLKQNLIIIRPPVFHMVFINAWHSAIQFKLAAGIPLVPVADVMMYKSSAGAKIRLDNITLLRIFSFLSLTFGFFTTTRLWSESQKGRRQLIIFALHFDRFQRFWIFYDRGHCLPVPRFSVHQFWLAFVFLLSAKYS